VHACGLQAIHGQPLPVHVAPKGAPVVVVTPDCPQPRQPIVADVQWVDQLLCAPAQGTEPLLRPGGAVAQAMSGLREDMGEPTDSDPPEAEPHTVAVGGKVFVQQRLRAQAFQLG
jgi:hypothetical protein